MTSNNLQPEGDWENQLNLIWERAHIPEWALDAKTAISRLFKESIAAEKEKWEKENAEDFKDCLNERVADEREKITAKFNYEKGKTFDRGMDMERTRCIKEIEEMPHTSKMRLNDEYREVGLLRRDFVLKIIKNEK